MSTHPHYLTCQGERNHNGGKAVKEIQGKISQTIYDIWLMWQFTVAVNTSNPSGQVQSRKLGSLDKKYGIDI